MVKEKDFLTLGEILEQVGLGEIKAENINIYIDVIAKNIKDWAIGKGVTHYAHWFQPLTGNTAEKQEVIESLSADDLKQGEPDASSFPNGCLRDTFEARGYTSWDMDSPIFIRTYGKGNKVLCIPTIFCSYTGESLCKKLPLLKSQKQIGKQALRILQALGNTTSTRIITCTGAEQEYFLVSKDLYEKRPDLVLTGRTLFGKPSPRGQDLQDHYFGAIKDGILAFMSEVEVDLKKMGVPIQTRHNEVAPKQYELAVNFSTASIATDHNQLVMETLQKIALRHGLVCLLHEKPFAKLNGSGKHNNWSLSTDDGINLFRPGNTQEELSQFLLFVSAVIRGVDKYSGLLRMSATNIGNAHRLGGHEAPPAIISIYLGKVISRLLQSISEGKEISFSNTLGIIDLGVDTLAQIEKHSTDRNRTSSLAFTGNKFEFRMAPSSISIAGINVVLNTIVAEALDNFANRLEKSTDKKAEMVDIIKETLDTHGKVIFDGDNYSEDWQKEADKRKLPNIKSTVEAISQLGKNDVVQLFEKYKIFSKDELDARVIIYVQEYIEKMNIEAETAIDMVNTLYLPAIEETIRNKGEQEGADLKSLEHSLSQLQEVLTKAQNEKDLIKRANQYENLVKKEMDNLRKYIDGFEAITSKRLWPVPSYTDLLFGTKNFTGNIFIV